MVKNLVVFVSMTGVTTKIGQAGLVQCKFQHVEMVVAMNVLIVIGVMGQVLNRRKNEY